MLIHGDARSLPLADLSVDCVVTSPPYWGLRDYGTATWVGGDAACVHRIPATGSTQNKGNNNREGTPFGARCGICGAQRIDAQIGLEPTPAAYVASLVTVFTEVWRVLKDEGTVWLNLGDSYAASQSAGDKVFGNAAFNVNRPSRAATKTPARVMGDLKPKDLIGIPWRVAFALQDQGWYLRSDIIWAKPNPMPESVTDRPTKAHEYLFLLTKAERYYYDADAIREAAEYGFREWTQNNFRSVGDATKAPEHFRSTTKGGDGGTRNRRTVWTIPTMPYAGAHFATMPEALVEPCILAGCPLGGVVLDPFLGSGTVGAVAERLGRRWVGTDLAYHDLAQARTAQRGFQFSF
jgi:DNA modification methylase